MTILSKFLTGATDRVGQGVLLDGLPADPAAYTGAVVTTADGVYWSDGIAWNSLGSGGFSGEGPGILLPKIIRVGPSEEADYALLEDALKEAIVSTSYAGPFANLTPSITGTLANFIFELENGDHPLPTETAFQNVYVMIRAINAGSASITIDKQGSTRHAVRIQQAFLYLRGLTVNIVNGGGGGIVTERTGGQILLLNTELLALECSIAIAIENGKCRVLQGCRVESDPNGNGPAIRVEERSFLGVVQNNFIKGGKYGIMSQFGASNIGIICFAGENITISGKEAAITAGGVGTGAEGDQSTWNVGAWDGYDGTITLEGGGIGISCGVASRVLYRGSKTIFDNCLDDIDQPPNKLLKGGGCVSDLEGPELSLIT